MIDVLVGGTFSVLQDEGRFGFRKFGIPIAGAMDAHSARFANRLIGNSDYAPVLEFVGQGPVLRFDFQAVISIQGAKFSVRVNDKLIDVSCPHSIISGDQITLGTATEGVYGYLAIQGGFLAPSVLGSVSFYDGITPIERIRKGAKLFYDLHWKKSNEVVDLAENLEKINYSDPFLTVMKGPEFDELCDQTRFLLENDQFVLSSEINRMGYRLTGNEALKGAEILTSPVQPGTIQLTPSGQLIVLMKDGQTTGGYARILQLSETSLSKLAQKRPGDIIKFIF
jgi:biotin-dependent carboxylase-like uncharacterized protein